MTRSYILLKADSVGSFASRLLERFHKGTVVETFSRTANIKLNGELITLSCLYQSPYGVLIKSPKAPFNTIINPGDGVRVKYLEIQAGRTTVSTQNADIYYPCEVKTSIPSRLFEKRVLFCLRILNILAPNSSMLDKESIFYPYFRERIKRLAETDSFRDAFVILKEMIGVGHGFTPSGDDFVMGFLYGSRCMGIRDSFKHLRIPSHNKTHWTSAKMIDYAELGYVIEPFRNFSESILDGNDDKFVDNLALCLRVGHSSGVDWTIGFLLSLAHSTSKRFMQKSIDCIFPD